MNVTGVIFPSHSTSLCWTKVLLLFLSHVASFFAADLLGIHPQSQVAAWLFSRKLVIDPHSRRKGEASLFLNCKVGFQVHIVCFSSVSSVLNSDCSFHLAPFLPLFFRWLGAPECLPQPAVSIFSLNLLHFLILFFSSACPIPAGCPVLPDHIARQPHLTTSRNQTWSLHLRT